jgi:hypothetical protein
VSDNPELMRPILCSIALVVFLCEFCAADQRPVPDVKIVRQAIRNFRVDPGRVRGDAARTIFRYAEESKDVELVMNRAVVSFISNQKENGDERSTLLLAFIVGNVEAQWSRRQTKDDSYAGVLQVIATYRQLQGKNPMLRIPEVEKLIELQKRGKLKRFVENA